MVKTKSESKNIKFNGNKGVLSFDKIEIRDGGKNFEFYFSYDEKIISREFFIDLNLSKVPDQTVKNILFHIGLFCLMDLDQMYVPRVTEINAVKMVQDQIDFYKKARQMYCRQHFYERRIPYSALGEVVSKRGTKLKPAKISKPQVKVAMAFGGGKESTLAHAIFKDANIPVVWFLKTRKPYRKTLLSIVENKKLEPLVHLTEEGVDIYKNAYTTENYASRTHTGVSIYLMTLLLVAASSKASHVCLGNELSSNDPYCFWDGQIVNHQFDKTKDYRIFIQDYIKKHILKNVNIFSLFEGVYEYRIAELMKTKGADVFRTMTSCNYLSDDVKWCHKCPKCAWSFAILTFCFGQKQACEVVGKDLFLDVKIFKVLLDPALPKPFECVGERPEVWAVLQKCSESGAKGPVIDEYLLKYQEKFLEFRAVWETKYSSVLHNEDLPKKYSKKIQKELEK